MTKPMVRIHNAETDEIIDRKMTDSEFAQFNQDKANSEAKEAEAEAKASAKSALLERLGISEDEAKLLLS
jgi:hypothetical protein